MSTGILLLLRAYANALGIAYAFTCFLFSQHAHCSSHPGMISSVRFFHSGWRGGHSSVGLGMEVTADVDGAADVDDTADVGAADLDGTAGVNKAVDVVDLTDVVDFASAVSVSISDERGRLSGPQTTSRSGRASHISTQLWSTQLALSTLLQSMEWTEGEKRNERLLGHGITSKMETSFLAHVPTSSVCAAGEDGDQEDGDEGREMHLQ